MNVQTSVLQKYDEWLAEHMEELVARHAGRDGDSIPTCLHDLELQIGAERFTGKVGFSERLGAGNDLRNLNCYPDV